MNARFMSNTPYANTEFEMQRIPGFTPRRSGISISRISYTARDCDCDCGCCIYQGRKGSCQNPSGCVCLQERLAAGCVPFSALLGVLTAEVRERPFVSRVSHLSARPRAVFTAGGHRNRFEKSWQEQGQMPDRNGWCAALYLLTADTFLWSRSISSIQPDFIDFGTIRIHGVDLDGYVLFHTAKDLYKGTSHISLSELTDPELVSDEAFRLVVTAFLICRYGVAVLATERMD